jgi:hypothetical protein
MDRQLRVAGIAGVSTFVLYFVVVIRDYFIEPSQFAQDHFVLFLSIVTLYHLRAVSYAIFMYGFARLGANFGSHLLSGAAYAAAVLSLIWFIGALSILLLPIRYSSGSLAFPDWTFVIGFSASNILGGISLLKLTNRFGPLATCTAITQIIMGVATLFNLDDVPTWLFVLLGSAMMFRASKA